MSSKKRTKVFIRCDSSATLGTGHLMRMLLLAEGLKDYFNLLFVTQDLPGNRNHLISRHGFETLILNDPSLIPLTTLIEREKPALLILDHYGFTLEEEDAVRELCGLAVFDDMFLPHHADWVINHSIVACKSDYDTLILPSCNVLCGERYTLLKKEFLEPHRPSSKKRKALIALGGSDPLHLSESIARFAGRYGYDATIVTTRANPCALRLKRRRPSTLIDVENMADLMKSHDLIITSASTTMIEAIALRIPFLAIQVAQNQQRSVDILRSKGLYNIITHPNRSELSRALRFLRYRPRKLKRWMDRFTFQQGGIAKELIRAYSR